MAGNDRDYYGSSVDMKFGSVTTDASAPTGLEDFKSASFLANIKTWGMDEDDKKDGGESTYEDADICMVFLHSFLSSMITAFTLMAI
jgi:hypothetical protein